MQKFDFEISPGLTQTVNWATFTAEGHFVL